MKQPLVTVVIPTHNRCDLLERTLRSVLGQCLDDVRDRANGAMPLEVVIVDEASADRTGRFLRAVSTASPAVRVVRHDEAMGVSVARNAGLQRARGRWVAFCDDDDVWAPGKLAAQLRALELSERARWCAVGSVTVDEDLRILVAEQVPRAAIPAAGGDVRRELLHINAIPGGGSGVLADTDLVRQVGGFDPALSVFADWDMWTRLSLTSPLVAIDSPLMAYHWHAGGMSRQLAEIDRELAYMADKYADVRVDNAIAMGWESMYRWVAMMHLLSNRRRDAASAYVKAGRAAADAWRQGGASSVSPLLMGRTLVSLFMAGWPGLHALRRGQHLRRAPHGWLPGARSWLVAVDGHGCDRESVHARKVT